jgi:tryptophanyl-tRNA synthetase
MLTDATARSTAHAPADGATDTVKVFSGIQPSGNFHLGNYLGAIRNWVDQIERSDSIFCVVDLHALSNNPEPEEMRQNIFALASTLLASGLDPDRCLLFVQSDVPAHSELQWLLNSVTQFGELRRMTQFKDKSAGKGDSVSAAVLSYPVLMAADIILYDAEEVPVGDDQRQHVELTRDIVQRFNARYGETFVMPKADIKPEAARIMALDNPTEKMSKSSGRDASYVLFSDTPDQIRKKIRRAVTDSGETVTAGEDKPALTNLIQIYGALTHKTTPEVEAHFAGKRYGDFKKELAEVVVDALAPIQDELRRLERDPAYVSGILTRGAEQANEIANAKMKLVRERMGIGRPR